ncbi:hypothetical protein CGL56_00590 [Neolewinella marina]|uniref:Tripartite ATP-independent periplasmic transporters DctQ component domain-containing protein n=1 Tax=Neolewinella marina TaxID=438751 RepID=A0A2G0CKK4_9BACT|nr:hypothetical protein CGL56_00590 [Neolewinella marina]
MLNILLIILVVVDVLLRWFFSLTAAWVIELEWHLFSLIFLLGIPYALQQDRHVRVDLFYEKFSPADKRLVNLVGGLIFLLPWAVVLLYFSTQYAYESWLSAEGSPNPNGIPRYFPIKAVVPFSAALLILQGLAECYRAATDTTPQPEES